MAIHWIVEGVVTGIETLNRCLLEQNISNKSVIESTELDLPNCQILRKKIKINVRHGNDVKKTKRLKYSTIDSSFEVFSIEWRGQKYVVRLHEKGVADRIFRIKDEMKLGWRSLEVTPCNGKEYYILLNFLVFPSN